jgi:hypothetical protein
MKMILTAMPTVRQAFRVTGLASLKGYAKASNFLKMGDYEKNYLAYFQQSSLIFAKIFTHGEN